ncbi:hypothetical protein UFOVP1454_45 [uncultured Caudovirales phage]|uniref:Portal protein n=1 Tax=uncultured Caudovirales phage TaxID=2100421 RepID=A0A6J5SIS7_9CAUD|nr:hypothetical protein UFOVP1454_45 [uncultured Caudovirales phage]
MPILSDKLLLKQWENHKEISDAPLSNQHDEARNDHAFHAGDKMAYVASVNDKSSKSKSSKSMVVFNKVKPYIDAVTGFMVQLRRKPEYLARITDNQQQQELSSYLNALSDYARAIANLDQLETRQDREMLITGYGAIDTNVVYERNPDGEVRAENVEFDDIFWDPQAREPNLLDARWVHRRKKFSKEEAERRYPAVKPEDFEGYKEGEGSYDYNPQGGLYDKISIGSGEKEEDLVEIYCYQWWELQTYYRSKNPLFEIDDPYVADQLGRLMELMRSKREATVDKDVVEDYFEFDPFAEYLVMTPQIRTDMEAAFKRFNIDVEYQEYQKRVYYTAMITGDTILAKYKSPDQRGFTIKFKTGDYDYENQRWFGMVAALKQPARYANKALTEMLYVIASNSKGGVMYEESAVENPAKFEQQWATTKAAIQVNDGALAGGKIQPKAQASLPNGYENIYTISTQSLGEVTGINKEFLGNSNNTQVSGLLESQRINQVVSTLACYFDSIASYQKEHAQLMITYIRILAENSEGRLVKIIGADGAVKFDVITSKKLADEYDVDISESPTTATQRQETTQMMITMADKLAALGMNIYPVAVQYLPIKQADKQKLLEILTPAAPDPQAQAQKQAMDQLAMDAQAAQIAWTKGETIYKHAQIAKIVAEEPQVKAATDKTRAETLKILADGEQKHIENDVIKASPMQNVNISI